MTKIRAPKTCAVSEDPALAEVVGGVVVVFVVPELAAVAEALA